MSKGGSMEREICVLLSKWWTDGKRDDIFYRSNASGGRFTSRKKSGKDTANQGGDVTFTDSIGEPLIKAWSVEIKTGYGGREKVKDSAGTVIKKIQHRWDILDILDSSQKQTTFEMMWEQCCRDANLSHRIPVLVFRRNQRKVCAAIPVEYKQKLIEFYGDPRCKTIVYRHKDFNILILPFKEFLEWLHDFDKYLVTFD
jgi:hypothetical protein